MKSVSANALVALGERVARDVAANLSFFTRLPAPFATHEAPDWRRIAWAAPLAGALVGAIGGLTAVIASALALPTWICATLGVGALVAATGALHEDGLADVADGLGGGSTRERKLEIMRDSRIGAYGATVLILTLLLRVEALTTMLARARDMGEGFTFASFVLAGAAARAGALAMLGWLPPARTDGAGATARGLGSEDVVRAVATLGAIAVIVGVWELGVTRALFACVVAAGAAWLVGALAKRHIGGQTGDVCGAAAMICEVAALCALLIGVRAA